MFPGLIAHEHSLTPIILCNKATINIAREFAQKKIAVFLAADGNPGHGIALTPDEKEIWLADRHNMRLHIFSAVAPYQQLTTIPLQDMPGWITFSIDGKYVYPSSGDSD